MDSGQRLHARVLAWSWASEWVRAVKGSGGLLVRWAARREFFAVAGSRCNATRITTGYYRLETRVRGVA